MADLTDDAADEAGAALLQAAQKDAIASLADIQELRKADRDSARRMMAGADFASGREQERRGSGSSKGLESKGNDDTYEAAMRGLKQQQEASASSSFSKGAPGKAGPGHRKQLSEKLVDEVIALEIQRDLLQLYSQPEVRKLAVCINTSTRLHPAQLPTQPPPPGLISPINPTPPPGPRTAGGDAEGGRVRAVPLRRAPPPLHQCVLVIYA